MTGLLLVGFYNLRPVKAKVVELSNELRLFDGFAIVIDALIHKAAPFSPPPSSILNLPQEGGKAQKTPRQVIRDDVNNAEHQGASRLGRMRVIRSLAGSSPASPT